MPETRRVLVVDDDEPIRAFLLDLLADEGYEARAAADGQEGLGMLGWWRPHAIVLDLMMPVMDGFAFREAQRQTDERDVPVILITARRELGASVEALGAAAILRKPFEIEALIAAVEDAMSARA